MVLGVQNAIDFVSSIAVMDGLVYEGSLAVTAVVSLQQKLFPRL
jgi:hypothetical protein